MITDRQAKAIKPGDKPKQTGIVGLTLKPTATKGRGKWTLRYVSPVTGKRRDMGLGTYPDTPVADALEQGRKAREQIAAGICPIEARKEQEAVPTFEQAARERYAQLLPGWRGERRRNWIRSLELYAFPHIGHIRVDDLKPQHFADMLRPVWLDIQHTAGKVKQRCHAVMAAQYAKGNVQGNPLDVVDLLLPKQASTAGHFPAMPWQEVPAFIQQHLTREPLLGSRAALLFLLLTATRSNEVRGATWDEIDFDARLWVIPKQRMKAQRAHRVPLSTEALDVLRQQQGQHETLIFPSLQGKKLSDMALSSLLRRAKAPSDTPGRVATAHGFRASFRNWCADCGYSSDIAERALAHTIGNKVQAAYERTDRLEARIELMEHWGAHIMGAGANVVTLRGQA